MEYNGQTKKEYEKNFTRIRDIITKADGDKEKALRLAKTQADRIEDEYKAINRSNAAVKLGHEWLADPFFERAYELGSVGKGEYREYKLKKLFEMQS